MHAQAILQSRECRGGWLMLIIAGTRGGCLALPSLPLPLRVVGKEAESSGRAIKLTVCPGNFSILSVCCEMRALEKSLPCRDQFLYRTQKRI